MVFASVKRDADNFFTIVNWQLSRYSGRWLTDSLTITEVAFLLPTPATLIPPPPPLSLPSPAPLTRPPPPAFTPAPLTPPTPLITRPLPPLPPQLPLHPPRLPRLPPPFPQGTSADSILWTGEEYDEEDEDEVDKKVFLTFSQVFPLSPSLSTCYASHSPTPTLPLPTLPLPALPLPLSLSLSHFSCTYIHPSPFFSI